MTPRRLTRADADRRHAEHALSSAREDVREVMSRGIDRQKIAAEIFANGDEWLKQAMLEWLAENDM